MLNKNLYLIEKENTFSRSSRLVKDYKALHPEKDVISLGIGDVSFPVAKPVADAMKKACEDMASMENFRGYGAYWGILSLRKAIAENDYRGLDIGPDEIFVGDGTKTDSTALLELFDIKSKILTGNPMYPIYRNGAYALGRRVYSAGCTKDYKMVIPRERFDIIYICSPCNPVGNAYTRAELSEWIKYANDNRAFIIFDNVYHDFISDPDVPQSIYELDGSRTCAFELRSYSKNISFSGIRCSYLVIPKEMGPEIHELWKERTINRFNGASYISQKGAEASYSRQVQETVRKNITAYKENAAYLRKNLLELGFKVEGGTDSPYLWCSTPDRLLCWDAFRLFLEELNIVIIPGSIFGTNGKYSFRISALGSLKDSETAIERIRSYYEKKQDNF